MMIVPYELANTCQNPYDLYEDMMRHPNKRFHEFSIWFGMEASY
jgi:hypothetical protein